MTNEERLAILRSEREAVKESVVTDTDRSTIVDAAIRSAVEREFRQDDRTALFERTVEAGLEAALAMRMKLASSESRIVKAFVDARIEEIDESIEETEMIDLLEILSPGRRSAS